MVSKSDILAVVDGGYGSSGKGVVVSHLANQYAVHVRVGSVQAGHSHFHKGVVYKQQVIPVGWVNPDAILIIGRGALVSFEQLVKEVEEILPVDPTILDRLFIDSRAGVLSTDHHHEEGGTVGALHQRIGSTGEGVGAARIARIRRDPSNFKLAHEVAAQFGGTKWTAAQLLAEDVHVMVQSRERPVLLEGAQGAGLSLIHGPWPYVTSADTGPAQMAADIGIPPRFVNRTMMVVRSHPIRVAGNSGPLKNEITWDEMSRRLGKPVIEQTTVTKKTRRIGEWDEDLFLDSLRVTGPTSLALMFADYLSPEAEGVTQWEDLPPVVTGFVTYLEALSGVPVALVGTGKGPDGAWKVVDRGDTP